jgi:uncharacterized cupin superfamily protein
VDAGSIPAASTVSRRPHTGAFALFPDIIGNGHAPVPAPDERWSAMTEETPFLEWPTGLAPEREGWFVVNVRDAAWVAHEAFGTSCLFENPRGEPLPEFGIRVRVLQPGQPMSLYHEEAAQEGFLVLAGECVLVVNGEERRLRTWDFFHSPAGTEHVLVGAGGAPAAVLAVGARPDPETFRYPVSDLAARYGASVAVETSDPDEAYAGMGEWDLGRPESADRLPWAQP